LAHFHVRAIFGWREWRAFKVISMNTFCVITMASAVALALAIPAGSLHAQTAVSGTHRGVLINYQLNGDIGPNRGVCFQMQPTLPGANPWACVYQDRPLYNEISGVLLAARFAKKECQIAWNSLDADTNRIVSLVDC
jgi:hypothetical protein